MMRAGAGGGSRQLQVVPLPAPPPPFQRHATGRCSVQPVSRTSAHHHPYNNPYQAAAQHPCEYFIPRSASEHNLCSTIELEKLPPLPPSALRSTATLARPPRPPPARDKMVTFEDEKPPYGHHRSTVDLIV